MGKTIHSWEAKPCNLSLEVWFLLFIFFAVFFSLLFPSSKLMFNENVLFSSECI